MSKRLRSFSAPDLTEAKVSDTEDAATSPQLGEEIIGQVEQAIALSHRRSPIPVSNAAMQGSASPKGIARQTNTSARNRRFRLNTITRELRGILNFI
ncbi:MAG: hypothetical protein KME05_20585 [Gloeocapsa sp. UFS-A4-WI-NPMV-4B04]|nr:hypothetical protein [Gloeocapsa sp. UFS-A4-WI-NPMV-4B04]